MDRWSKCAYVCGAAYIVDTYLCTNIYHALRATSVNLFVSNYI